MGHLPKNDYLQVIKNTQLMATDLIIFNYKGEVLLGKRKNEPAKDSWFVPGGRIYKYEPLGDAVHRVSKNELGVSLSMDKPNGVYHHMYNNNVDNNDFGTHYVVFAVSITISYDIDIKKDNQHEDMKWWSIEDIVNNDQVHLYTKNYFHPFPSNKVF